MYSLSVQLASSLEMSIGAGKRPVGGVSMLAPAGSQGIRPQVSVYTFMCVHAGMCLRACVCVRVSVCVCKIFLQ